MADAGIPQGFIRFGTVAHRILLALHVAGELRHHDLVDELPDVDVRGISIALNRMSSHGLVYRLRKAPRYATGEPTQWVYGLTPPTRRAPTYRQVSHKVRSARYRAALRMRVPTVFDWRPA